jgi:hypothetical protein
MIPDNGCHHESAAGFQEATIALHRRGLIVSITIAQNRPVPMPRTPYHAAGNVSLKERNTRARVRDRFSAFNKDTERNTSA